MNNNDFEFDIDSILAEFTSDTAPKKAEETPQKAEPVSIPAERKPVEPTPVVEEKKPEPAGNTVENAIPDPDATVVFSSGRETGNDESSGERPEPQEIKTPLKKSEKIKPSKKKETEYEPKQPKKRAEKKPMPILSIVFGVCFATCLVWGLFTINPFKANSSGMQPIATPAPTSTPEVSTAETEETAIVDVPETTEEPEEEKTVYKLEEGQMAPKPNEACYGQVSVTNASEIDNIIAQAREMGLLGKDEKVAFNSNADFNQGSYYQDIMYYLDPSILAIAWKEIEDGYTLTMCEIKIADGSQFRMEVFGDIYNENDNSYLSQMVMANNAVVAMNSDKCKARGDGVLVCNRVLYKYNENVYAGMLKRYNCLDNCYVTGDGDMLFTKRLEEMTTEEMQQYIADNDIIFSISFGPLLIENGEMVYGYNPGDDNYIEYAYGETEKPYSRCGMGQIDTRHYLYVSLNHSDEQEARWTMREFAQHIYDRGIMESFYGLDGGQTAELIINNTIYNHIDFGAERYTSNCIYFATAIPEGEG